MKFLMKMNNDTFFVPTHSLSSALSHTFPAKRYCNSNFSPIWCTHIQLHIPSQGAHSPSSLREPGLLFNHKKNVLINACTSIHTFICKQFLYCCGDNRDETSDRNMLRSSSKTTPSATHNQLTFPSLNSLHLRKRVFCAPNLILMSHFEISCLPLKA